MPKPDRSATFVYGDPTPSSTDPMRVLGEILKRHREERGYSRDMVADRVNVGASMVRAFEAGGAVPTPRSWMKYRKMVARGLDRFNAEWEAAWAADQRREGRDDEPPPSCETPDESPDPGDWVEVPARPWTPSLPLPEVSTETFGRAHRLVRDANGDTTSEVVEIYGVTSSAVTAWETGACLPVALNATKVAQLYPELTPWIPLCWVRPKPDGYTAEARLLNGAPVEPLPPAVVEAPPPPRLDAVQAAGEAYTAALRSAHRAELAHAAADAALREAQAALQKVQAAAEQARQARKDSQLHEEACHAALLQAVREASETGV